MNTSESHRTGERERERELDQPFPAREAGAHMGMPAHAFAFPIISCQEHFWINYQLTMGMGQE